MEDQEGFSTKCVHAGEPQDSYGSPHSPLYNTTTFSFPDTRSLLDVVDGKKKGPLYTRYGMNPTIQSLEDKLASLENGESALAFCSGMAAEAAVLFAFGQKGILCIGDAYGGTMDLLQSHMRPLGIKVKMMVGEDLPKLEEELKTGYGILYFETPTNPKLEIFDIEMLAKTSHKYGAITVIDNTFGTPVNQNPLLLGADIVVHSATKYLGGHSDITAGFATGKKELMNSVFPWRKNLGQTIAPETASLLSRSIRSLSLRVERQNQTALALARKMEKLPGIKKVFYPGLESFQGHLIAKKQMKGFGGMITIELAESIISGEWFVDRLKLFKIAPSLGGAESLVTQPVTTTHHGLPQEELKKRGILERMIRLSVGFEDEADLFGDIRQALG